MGVKMVRHEMMAEVLKTSFSNWASKDPTYKSLYKKLSDEALSLVYDGLSEIAEYKPYYFDVWWVKNHNRYRKLVKNEEIRVIVQMVFTFLGLFSRGKLHGSIEKTTAKTKRKKAPRS